MAQVIKKAKVPQSILTELDWDSESYLIRYRIVSENKNTTSHWSPVYSVPAPQFEEVNGSITDSIGPASQTILTISWENTYNLAAHDVFVAYTGDLTTEPTNTFLYDGSTFFFHGISNTTTYSFAPDASADTIRIIVQPASNKKTIKASLVLFDDIYTSVS